MPDREWFTVETRDGTLIGGDGLEYANQETAADMARERAAMAVVPLVVVKYTREEVTLFEKEVNVTEIDLSVDAAKA